MPGIPKSGQSLKDFVPANWKIRDTISYDFNKDGLKDYAVVIESVRPVEIKHDTVCFSDEPFYPKLLFILLKKEDNTLILSSSNSKMFGQCNWGVQGEDPYVGISIHNNTLGVVFLTGGTERNEISYFFKYQNKDWYLTGASSFQYWAGHQGSYKVDINLVTGIKESYGQSGIGKGKRDGYKKTVLTKKAPIKMNAFDDNYKLPLNDDN